MNKVIAILTATRAEYGLLKPVIMKMKKVQNIDTKVLVTGMHLSLSFGETYKEIEDDGLQIDKKFPILFDDKMNVSITNSMAMAMIEFGTYFQENKIDALVVLGDRYETFSAVSTAMMHRIPVCHIAGGEATEGLLDEAIRHCITKMSYLHFTSTGKYRERVIQLGESPDRVYNVGAPGVENAKNEPLVDKSVFYKTLNLNINKAFAVVTYHPVTLEKQSNGLQEIKTLCECFSHYEDMQFVITKANADFGGKEINDYLDKYAMDYNENIHVVDSLGQKLYLSALKYCNVVIGNSSSGIIEAPSFHVATVNIGDRQKGRIQADSIINVGMDKKEIIHAIDIAIKNKAAGIYDEVINPYEGERTSDEIVKIICEHVLYNKIDIMKKFYDIEVRGKSNL